jgi:hypothetical protein
MPFSIFSVPAVALLLLAMVPLVLLVGIISPQDTTKTPA